MKQFKFLIIFVIVIKASVQQNAIDCKTKPSNPALAYACCPKPPLITMAVMEECKQYSGNCGFECIMKKANVFQNGKFSAEAAKALATVGYANDPMWLNLTYDGIDTCFPLAESKAAEIAAIASSRQIDGVTSCNPYSAFLVQCMFGHDFISCPVYNSTLRGCDSLKDYLTACYTSLEVL